MVLIFKPGVPGFLTLLLSGKLVCISVFAPKLLITSSLIWTAHDWLKKFNNFYIAAVVGVISRPGIRIETCNRNQPNKSKLTLCKLLLSL